MYEKNVVCRHFHFITQSRFLTIPEITLSSAFDTIYLVPLRGAVSTYADDTLNAGDPAVLASVATVLNTYTTHRLDYSDIRFAGITDRTDGSGIHCDAGPCAAALTPLPLSLPLSSPLPEPKALHSLAAKLMWVGRVARHDILTSATHLAKILNPTGADARRANDTLAAIALHPISLHYISLDAASLCLDVYADYSGSATFPLDRRQLGYLVALVDASRRFSLLHWASHRLHRVCPVSCAGELLALADAVAAALDVRLLLQKLLSRRIPLATYTDSSAAYDLVTSFKHPTDVTAKNDLFMLLCSLLPGTIHTIFLVQGAHNPADALLKPSYARPAPNRALTNALLAGTLHVPVIS